MNRRQKFFTVLLMLLFLSMSGLLIYFSFRTAKTNEALHEKIQQLQLIQPQNGEDSRAPTNQELLNLIKPLIPKPIPGKDGAAQDGAAGKDGASGKDAAPCTTYTDEANDSYIACPDGTQTLIPKPDEPRQIELCSTPTITIGWRYVGTTICLKVKGE